MVPSDPTKLEEYRKKLSDASKRKWADPAYSTKTRKAMSLAHTGTTKSLEVRQKISDSQIGIPKPTSGVRGTRHYKWNPNKCQFKDYRREVQSLTEKNYRLHKHIINPQDFPRTKCGVEGGYQLDHIVSVKEGFDRKLPIHDIANINNLQMLPWRKNRAKGTTKENYREF